MRWVRRVSMINIFKKFPIWVVLLAALNELMSQRALAVSLIAGVPNAQTTPARVFMVAHESQVPLIETSTRWMGFWFFTLGLNEELELASTVYNLSSPASNRIAPSLGYKWVKQFGTSVFEPKMIVGQELLVPLQGTDGLGVWSFAGFSFRLPGLRTRFTGGPSRGPKAMFGRDLWLVWAGVEQPLSSDFSLIADWFSGDHDLGALIAAIQWQPNKALVVISGPKLANDLSKTVNAWMLEITYEFGHDG